MVVARSGVHDPLRAVRRADYVSARKVSSAGLTNLHLLHPAASSSSKLWMNMNVSGRGRGAGWHRQHMNGKGMAELMRTDVDIETE